jgi:hypothetical protein
MSHMSRRAISLVLLPSSLGLMLLGCAEGSYCQSGAKYGTRCYDVPASNGTAEPREAVERRSAEPAAPAGNGTPATTPR